MSQAQLLTADTIGGSYNNVIGNTTKLTPLNGMGVTQTFTGITSIDTLTVRFGSGSNGLSSPVNLQVYFSEWSGSAATTTVGSGFIQLAAPSTWTLDSGVYYYDANIDMTDLGTLTATTTYGFTVVGSATSQSNDVGIFQGQVAYADGSVFVHNAGNALTNAADVSHGAVDFAFIGSSIAANTAPFAPVPEASTVAVLFAGCFVGGMVCKRVRDRRRQAATAVN